MHPMEHLAERVLILRRARRMNQKELARAVEASSATISNLERNKLRSITIEHLVALARVLGTTPDDLLGIQGKATRSGTPT